MKAEIPMKAFLALAGVLAGVFGVWSLLFAGSEAGAVPGLLGLVISAVCLGSAEIVHSIQRLGSQLTKEGQP